MSIQRFGRRGRTVAVIGSIAMIGGGASAIAATRNSDGSHAGATTRSSAAYSGKPLASLSAAELAALATARAAIATDAVSIATPILDAALSAGTITSAEKAAFLDSLSRHPGAGAGPDGTWLGATGASGWTGASGPSGPPPATTHAAPSSAALDVFEAAQKAIEAQLSAIATPVLDKAVSAGSITAAQETTLLGLLEHGPHGAGGGQGGAPGGPMPAGAGAKT